MSEPAPNGELASNRDLREATGFERLHVLNTDLSPTQRDRIHQIQMRRPKRRFMHCKFALTESDWNIEAAIKRLDAHEI